jgi:branched-chain amino acid transport system substrate-binding protein
MTALDFPSMSRLGQACARVGYHPLYSVSTGAESLAADANLGNSLVFAISILPWSIQDGPGAEFSEATSALGDQAKSDHGVAAWAAAKMFEKAATATIGVGATPTSDAVLQGLWSFRDETTGGMTKPWTFTTDQPPPTDSCAFLMVTVDGRWTTPNGAAVECRPF